MSKMLSTTRRVELETQVDSVLSAVANAFRMDDEETARFRAKSIARLIAALPFLADCDRPERTAVEHLGTYVLSVRETRRVFHASPDDDESLFDRLAPIMRFKGGDAAIIRRGMALLAMNMVTDYARDVSPDRMLGKHNPVGSGVWDHDQVMQELRTAIEAVESPEMDRIMASDGGGTTGYWDW